MTQVFAFECGIRGWPVDGPGTIVNATSRGRAKSEFIRDLDMPEVHFTAITARKVGGPVTSRQFQRNAEYRGMPGVKCGDRVRVGNSEGIIVGHNSSANFDVEFTSGEYAGHRLNVHPGSIELMKKGGAQ